MKQATILWVVALAITVAAAAYQRMTGPTYPISGKVYLDGTEVAYRFERSHGGEGNQRVQLLAGNSRVEAVLEWKRFKTGDAWTLAPMRNEDGVLSADLPLQPPAGKLIYRVTLRSGNQAMVVPPEGPVEIRFKGDVPPLVLIPHIIAMFGAMLLSTRTGLEFFRDVPKYKGLSFWTVGLLFAGGMILGPIVQHYAFGAYWTGWPSGRDLTDNKTLVALVGWVAAVVALYRSTKPGRWMVVAAILVLVVYLVPHSLLGSELRYEQRSSLQQKPPP